MKKTKWTVFLSLVILLALAIPIIYSVSAKINCSKVEKLLTDEKYEHAFDLLETTHVKHGEKSWLIEKIIPGMQQQFYSDLTGDGVLNVDGLMICENNNALFYINGDGERVEVYRPAEPKMTYAKVRNTEICYDGKRKWITQDFIYSNGCIYFYEVTDTFKEGTLVKVQKQAVKVNVESGSTQILSDDVNLGGLCKFSDGSILIDEYDDTVYDPYENKLTQNEKSLVNKEVIYSSNK